MNEFLKCPSRTFFTRVFSAETLDVNPASGLAFSPAVTPEHHTAPKHCSQAQGKQGARFRLYRFVPAWNKSVLFKKKQTNKNMVVGD